MGRAAKSKSAITSLFQLARRLAYRDTLLGAQTLATQFENVQTSGHSVELQRFDCAGGGVQRVPGLDGAAAEVHQYGRKRRAPGGFRHDEERAVGVMGEGGQLGLAAVFDIRK